MCRLQQHWHPVCFDFKRIVSLPAVCEPPWRSWYWVQLAPPSWFTWVKSLKRQIFTIRWKLKIQIFHEKLQNIEWTSLTEVPYERSGFLPPELSCQSGQLKLLKAASRITLRQPNHRLQSSKRQITTQRRAPGSRSWFYESRRNAEKVLRGEW